MRINKYIGETGICSRREADRLIEAGRITVNGKIAETGSQVQEGDDVRLDGQPIGSKPRSTYIALNKPVGIECTTDPEKRDNIVDFVGHPQRIFPIGRLDKDSEGLILLTNDGDIVNKILRSENNHEKEYIVRVDKPITDSFISGMSSGVRILGEMTKRCHVNKVNEYTFRIILTQGLNRQIRRMCKAFGYRVIQLRRIRIMNIRLDELPLGKWRQLTEQELGELNRLCESSSKTAPSTDAVRTEL